MQITSVIDAGLLEIIGEPGVSELAKSMPKERSSSFKDASSPVKSFGIRSTEIALKSIYGEQVYAGIAQRAGGASLKYFLMALGGRLGFNDAEFRLLPVNKKKLLGLQRISDELTSAYGMLTKVSEKKDSYSIEITNCRECEGMRARIPSCHFILGFLHEYLSWLGGGRYFQVIETSCLARKDKSCLFELSKFAED